jgi:hypothetical protein
LEASDLLPEVWRVSWIVVLPQSSSDVEFSTAHACNWFWNHLRSELLPTFRMKLLCNLKLKDWNSRCLRNIVNHSHNCVDQRQKVTPKRRLPLTIAWCNNLDDNDINIRLCNSFHTFQSVLSRCFFVWFGFILFSA